MAQSKPFTNQQKLMTFHDMNCTLDGNQLCKKEKDFGSCVGRNHLIHEKYLHFLAFYQKIDQFIVVHGLC